MPSVVLAESKPVFETEVERKLADGIPRSFDELVKLFSDKEDKSIPLSLLLIPDGRSLVRKTTDFKDPRVLPIFSNANVFIGYAPRTGQAEIIAWNPGRGRYEFFLIDHLEKGKEPVLHKPPRAVCISCHQNEGPVFSRSPWTESHASNRSFLGSTLMDKLKQENSFRSSIPLAAPGTAFNFDLQVRVAARRLHGRDICEKFCAPDDRDCKLHLLAAAIRIENMAGFSADLPKEIEYFSRNYWPEILSRGFSRPSSAIPDRDPLEAKGKGGATTVLRADPVEVENFFTGKKYVMSGTEALYSESLAPTDLIDLNPSDKKRIQIPLDKIYGLEGAASPAFPRPPVSLGKDDMVLALIGAAEGCFSMSGGALGAWARGQGDIYAALKENPLSTILVHQWPPRVELIEQVVDQSEEACASCSGLAPVLDEKKIFTEVKNALEEQLSRPAKIFQKHCSECHDDIGAMVSGAKLPLGELELMKNYKKNEAGESLVHRYLRGPNAIMPPKSASHPLSPEDRKVLLEFLESGR